MLVSNSACLIHYNACRLFFWFSIIYFDCRIQKTTFLFTSIKYFHTQLAYLKIIIIPMVSSGTEKPQRLVDGKVSPSRQYCKVIGNETSLSRALQVFLWEGLFLSFSSIAEMVKVNLMSFLSPHVQSM